jgi:hypothetical protein
MTDPKDFMEVGEKYLEHFGKLGMKWGRRSYTNDQIKDSRARVKIDQKHANRLEKRFSGKAAKNEAARIRANLAGTDQLRIAKLKTSGEKKAILILTLGVGSIYLGRNRAIYNPKVRRGKEEVRRILTARATLKEQKKVSSVS